MLMNISSHGNSTQKVRATENNVTQAINRANDNAITTFHLAASLGDMNKLHEMDKLRRYGNTCVDITDGLGCTPLHYAVSGRQIEAVKYLVSRGADCHKMALNGATPLCMAKMLGDSDLLLAMTGKAEVDPLDDVLRKFITAISGKKTDEKKVGLLKTLAISLLSNYIDRNSPAPIATECLKKLNEI